MEGQHARSAGWVAGLLAVVLLAAGTVWVRRKLESLRPVGDDRTQILNLIAMGERQAERRNAAGIARLISRDYSDAAGASYDRIRAEIHQYLIRWRDVEVEVPGEYVQISTTAGGEAIASFPVRLAGSLAGTAVSSQFDMAIRLKKEPVRYLLVFSGEEWRIVSAEGYDGAPTD